MGDEKKIWRNLRGEKKQVNVDAEATKSPPINWQEVKVTCAFCSIEQNACEKRVKSNYSENEEISVWLTIYLL